MPNPEDAVAFECYVRQRPLGGRWTRRRLVGVAATRAEAYTMGMDENARIGAFESEVEVDEVKAGEIRHAS